MGTLLSFDAASHEYRSPDGRIVPSVTQVLEAVGCSTDFEALGRVSPRLAEQIEFKRNLGSIVHIDAHAYDDNDLDWSSVDPRVKPYIDAWKTFRENSGLVPIARERRLFHPVHKYAGTLDGVFEGLVRDRLRRILVDIKLGDPKDAGAHLQTAAYEGAWMVENAGAPIHERWAVQLCPGETVPYRITNFSDRQDAWQDFQKFQACLTVYREQPARRRSA